MTLKEVKTWINSLPDSFDDFGVMNGKVGKLDEQYSYRVDTPITTLMVDENAKEILIMHDDQEDFEAKSGDVDELDAEVDKLLKAIQSEKFSEKFKEQIEKDTWTLGNPMFYVDDDNWLIEHHKDGTKNKIRKLKDNKQ